MRRGKFGSKPHRLEIDVHDGVPGVLINGFKVGMLDVHRVDNASVVDECVQTTRESHGLLDHVLDLIGLREIGGDGGGLCAGFADKFSGLLKFRDLDVHEA